jgi:hypothetical protein
LLKLNNQRNNWFHFAHLQWNEQQLWNEASQVIDIVLFLCAYCLSHDTVKGRLASVERTMVGLGRVKQRLIEREELLKRAIGFVSLTEEQRRAKAVKSVEMLGSMLDAEDDFERETAEQFVLTFVAPYLDIKCPGKEDAFKPFAC